MANIKTIDRYTKNEWEKLWDAKRKELAEVYTNLHYEEFLLFNLKKKEKN